MHQLYKNFRVGLNVVTDRARQGRLFLGQHTHMNILKVQCVLKDFRLLSL